MRQVTRRLQSINNRVFNRITRDEIRDALAGLGLARGATVYASVSMRSVGYVREGPEAVIGAIQDLTGESGTILASAWPSADPSGVDTRALFDLAETPAATGLLAETLRRHAGALRSLHPVASVAALGALAAELTAGHEAASTPFGPDSPYGKLAKCSPKLLLIGAGIGGLLYHVMDRVDFPNLYAAEPVEMEVRDGSGRYSRVRTLLPRPGLPPVVILPGTRPENRDYLRIEDYALIFPPERERRLLEAGYLRANRSRFLGRLQRLVARNTLRLGRVGSAEAALVEGETMLEQVARDLAWDIARFKEEYDPEHLSVLSLPSV